LNTKLFRFIQILKALSYGYTVEIDGYTFGMDDNFDLCIETQRVELGAGADKDAKIVYMKIDWTLGQIVAHFNKIKDEDFAKLMSNLALTLALREKRGTATG